MTREEMQERIEAAMERYETSQRRPRRMNAWSKKATDPLEEAKRGLLISGVM